MFMIPSVLTIAGFDNSGGAGLQADLKTFSALACYGTSVLTALPIQNTMGVKKCYDIPLSAIQDQLEIVFSDIYPNAIKIGMLYKEEIIKIVADFIKKNNIKVPIVLDPVMLSKNGHALLNLDAICALKENLLPLITLLTPNLPEAEILVNFDKKSEISSFDMQNMAEKLIQMGSQSILLKGGHLSSSIARDLFLEKNKEALWLELPMLSTRNHHGTGCTLSSACAAYLAHGYSLKESCYKAKNYLYNALIGAKDQQIGQGVGSVHHFYHFWDK